MPWGKLKVHLIDAKSLENTDFFGNMDPYVIITCRTQQQQSSIASGKGSQPKWDEHFVFSVWEIMSELVLKIMDSDTIGRDDFVGETIIPVNSLFDSGSIPTTSYNVVKDGNYCGEIRVALNFVPQMPDRGFDLEEENVGGWKQSAHRY